MDKVRNYYKEVCLFIETIGAAKFLAKPIRGLGGKAHLELVEGQRRKDVFDLIYRIEYGIYMYLNMNVMLLFEILGHLTMV